MAKLPYGFDANPMYQTITPQDAAEAWDRLQDIQLSLEKREAVAPELAAWLGEAIEHAKRDPSELLRCLGLVRRRGRPRRDPNAWLVYGQKVCQLEDAGMKTEEALIEVLSEADDKFSRPTLQNWRDEYRRQRQAEQIGVDQSQDTE